LLNCDIHEFDIVDDSVTLCTCHQSLRLINTTFTTDE